jgi:hypothetical protein
MFVLLFSIAAIVLLFLALKLGAMKYHNRLLRKPRRCIRTGKDIKEWMGIAEFYKLRLVKAVEAMEDVDFKFESKLLKRQIKGTSISLRPSNYELSLAKGQPLVSNINEIVRHNTTVWRSRILERMNHMRFDNKLWKLLFWMLLLSYPSISVRVIGFFNCREIGHEFYLSKDLSVVCFDSLWALYTPVALAAMLVYVVGVPILFFAVLYQARCAGVSWNMHLSTLNDKRREHFLKEAAIDAKISMEFWAVPCTREDELKAIHAFLERRNLRGHKTYNRLGFIYYAYKEDCWWYEIIELSRKLILNGFAALISPGTQSQIVFGLVVCFLYLMFVMMQSPYNASTDHLLAVLCHIQLFLTMFCALMIRAKVKFVSTTIFPDAPEREAIETGIITWFVILSHGGLLFFGLCSIFYEKWFSKEIKELHKRKKHRDDMRKKALGRLNKGKNALTSKLKMAKLGAGRKSPLGVMPSTGTVDDVPTSIVADSDHDAFISSILGESDNTAEDNFWEDILGDEAASASPEKQLSSLFRESNSPKEETGQLQKARKPARIEKKQTFNRTRTQTIEL